MTGWGPPTGCCAFADAAGTIRPREQADGGGPPGSRAISPCPGLAFHYPYPHLTGSGVQGASYALASGWHAMALKTPGPASRGSGTIRASQAWTGRGAINLVWEERHSRRMRRLDTEGAAAEPGQAERHRRMDLTVENTTAPLPALA